MNLRQLSNDRVPALCKHAKGRVRGCGTMGLHLDAQTDVTALKKPELNGIHACNAASTSKGDGGLRHG